MNCTTALEAMLDAGPVELSGHGTTELTGHVATCARCHAVAQRIATDTRRLAAAIAPAGYRTPRRNATWTRRTLVPVGVTALLLFIARLVPNAPSGKPVVVGPPAVTPGVPAAPTIIPGAPILRLPASLRTRAFPAPLPVQPVRLTAVAQAAVKPTEGSATVIVDPPAGTRVAVMRTDNPKFTVVWLY